MSKIGKKPIIIPEGVRVEVAGDKIEVQGPKGNLERPLPSQVTVEKGEGTIKVKSTNSAFQGTWRAHIFNMVKGVSTYFEKKLEVVGIGYKVGLQGGTLTFQIGFSHPLVVTVPPGILCEVKVNTLTIRGVDKEKVGQFAAYIRSFKPPEAYKGKGIRYEGEVVKTKPGKKAGIGAQ